MSKESNEPIKPSKSIEVLPNEQVERGYVVLPYDEEHFKDFIKSLLGNPQTITKNIAGGFEITKDDIINVYHLILQRVGQQNEGILAEFTSKIVFSDNSSIELNSIEELLTYNEIRSVISRSIHLKWGFLVKFADKKTPEKQSIQLSFISSGASREYIDDTVLTTVRFREGGVVNFRIEHTARTWGADIEAMLTNHIESLIKPPNKVRQFLSDYSGYISFIAGAFLFIASLIGIRIATQNFAISQIDEINKLLQVGSGNDLTSIGTKIDNIANFIAKNPWANFNIATTAFLVVSIVLSILFAIWISDPINFYKEPSFVLLTKQSIKDKEATLKKLKNSGWQFILALITDVIVGIFSKYKHESSVG